MLALRLWLRLVLFYLLLEAFKMQKISWSRLIICPCLNAKGPTCDSLSQFAGLLSGTRRAKKRTGAYRNLEVKQPKKGSRSMAEK